MLAQSQSSRLFLDSAAEGVHGGGGAGEEDSAEDAVRAILRTTARRSIDGWIEAGGCSSPFEAIQ